tara:strand:- start:1067 stop:3445 length:2379 start_codon:yes stop_codon:yes gene_type:complete
MAIKIYEEFAPFANPGDTNYPNGSIKDDSTPGAEDGTPLAAVYGNDYVGFDAALLAEANITPSGSADTVLNSQRLTALTVMIRNKGNGTVTLSDAKTSTSAKVGEQVIISDRANGRFEYITAVTNNEMDIVECTGTPSLSLQLVVGDRIYVECLGAPVNATGNPTPYIERACQLSDVIDYGGSNNFYDIVEVIGIPSNSIYSDKGFRFTSSGATLHPSVSGEAIYTSASAKLDPESTGNLFSSKIEWDHVNYVQKNYPNNNTLPTFDGRIFNGDRLYNTNVHHNNFVAIERVVDSRRKKGTDSFLEEGYLQSFSLDFNDFAYCNYIVQYSYGFNVSFVGNKAEACQWGWHSVFDAGTLITPRFINNLFEGTGVFLKIPSAKGGQIHGLHMEMGNSPDASYLSSKALIDLSPAGPLTVSSVNRQWDIRSVVGSVPLIYDGDDFEFSLISTTNATYPNVKSPEITFSALSYRAEHLTFSQGSEVGSSTESGPNILRNANFQINQNNTNENTPVVTGTETDLWIMRSAASAAPITTYTAGFEKGGAYGGSHSFTLIGATKSHFMNQLVPTRRNIVNSVGGVGGSRAFAAINLDLPATTIVSVTLRYVRTSDNVAFGEDSQSIKIQAGTRLTHFSFDMPNTTRIDDSDYSIFYNMTFSGAAGEGTPPSDGTYKIFFTKAEFNSIFSTVFLPERYETDLQYSRSEYYRPDGNVECISNQGGASAVQTTCKTLPLTRMRAASYTVDYDSIDLYLNGVLTNVVSGPVVTFDGTTVKVSHNGGATFNGYEQINGLTITAD